ncbi:hypothetical protein KVR01_009543 [Diaporthe batatas]|uniref:uncharacterized protein n=1 Tax=Diaporthe batatas TaxID=748121 RepID=UPI001D054673|nr:uncharacterized protein KVR01_009543 [Diaporthe batatas]KAG8161279.1 hypothetical protein KVR01_009543 [Diaporthe batatas]
MTLNSICLKVSVGLLMVVSIIELSLISATVGFLSQRAKGTFDVVSGDSTYPISGEPANLIVDQGHTSNGASGTAFIIIGCCGFLALWLRDRPAYHAKSFAGIFSRGWYRLWLGLNVPALLLTLGALAFTFAVANAHDGQRIDLGVARGLNGEAYSPETWTPQNWFDALLKLDLASHTDRNDIQRVYRIARGWQYNLIPFFIVQLAQTVLALLEASRKRKAERQYGHDGAKNDLGYAGK